MIKVKNTVIGQDRPQICIPITSRSKNEILDEAKKVVEMTPDLVEWRIDYLLETENEGDISTTLHELKRIMTLKGIPILCTIRREGKVPPNVLADDRYMQYNIEIIKSGDCDFVDIELSADNAIVKKLIQCAEDHNVKTIVSYHDFLKTPPKEVIIDKMHRMYELNADICKAALMPENSNDVLAVFEVCAEIQKRCPGILPICISMGETGKASRICGGLFGSVITYAAGVNASAPGQINGIKMREFIDALYGIH